MRFLAAAIALMFLSRVALADEERPLMGALSAGGHSAITGSTTWGAASTLVLLPGGALDRYGVRAAAKSDGDELGDLALTIGPVFEAGAARPRVTVLLFGEAGVHTAGTRPIAGAGAGLHVWLIGPLSLTLESGALFLLDGTDSELAIGGAALLGIGNIHTPWRPEHLDPVE